MQRIGVVGGGQLALMMGEAIKAKKLPYKLIVLDPTENCPASPVATQIIGDFKDEEKIKKLAELSDIVTFEIELASSTVLKDLAEAGKPVHPSPATLGIIKDKLDQAMYLTANGIAVPRSRAVANAEDISIAAKMYGLPLMIKARTDSYDGKGNAVLHSEGHIPQVLEQFAGQKLMAQQYIEFDTEVSIIAARSVTGEIKVFDLGENQHGASYNILERTIVPARVSYGVLRDAELLAEQVLDVLGGAGVFGIEMLVKDEEVMVNEIAPRVHNSGHHTVEACSVSQFEQHLYAISGAKLRDPSLVRPAVMHNIIGTDFTGPYVMVFSNDPVEGTVEVSRGVFVHDYGKHVAKPRRKLGHMTILGQDDETRADLIDRAAHVYAQLELRKR